MGKAIIINGQIEPKSKTSEEILGIRKPPENTCPDIDSIIKAINKVYNIAYRSKCECREIGDGCGHEDKFYDIQYELTGLENELEKLREANANLRTWGQDWKNLAKQLLNKYEPNWKENKEE
jgi:hypothetical protein